MLLQLESTDHRVIINTNIQHPSICIQKRTYVLHHYWSYVSRYDVFVVFELMMTILCYRELLSKIEV